MKSIGIRPGEKLHEVMCPADDSHLTLEFDDHYVIKPTITVLRRSVDYAVNRLGERGKAGGCRASSIHSGTEPSFPRDRGHRRS